MSPFLKQRIHIHARQWPVSGAAKGRRLQASGFRSREEKSRQPKADSRQQQLRCGDLLMG
jgi:hypothetical protein